MSTVFTACLPVYLPVVSDGILPCSNLTTRKVFVHTCVSTCCSYFFKEALYLFISAGPQVLWSPFERVSRKGDYSGPAARVGGISRGLAISAGKLRRRSVQEERELRNQMYRERQKLILKSASVPSLFDGYEPSYVSTQSLCARKGRVSRGSVTISVAFIDNLLHAVEVIGVTKLRSRRRRLTSKNDVTAII